MHDINPILHTLPDSPLIRSSVYGEIYAHVALLHLAFNSGCFGEMDFVERLIRVFAGWLQMQKERQPNR